MGEAIFYGSEFSESFSSSILQWTMQTMFSRYAHNYLILFNYQLTVQKV